MGRSLAALWSDYQAGKELTEKEISKLSSLELYRQAEAQKEAARTASVISTTLNPSLSAGEIIEQLRASDDPNLVSAYDKVAVQNNLPRVIYDEVTGRVESTDYPGLTKTITSVGPPSLPSGDSTIWFIAAAAAALLFSRR